MQEWPGRAAQLETDPVKIALVTTWQQPCGIATYSENLGAALRDLGHEVVVLAEQSDEIREDTQVDLDGIAVHRCWHRTDRAPTRLIDTFRAVSPDVVHLQHEFGLFPERNNLFRFLQATKKAAGLFVTPHTITDRGVSHLAWLWPFLRTTGARLMVHTVAGFSVLRDDWRYPLEQMRVIPHGAPAPALTPPRNIAREHLDLPADRFILLTLGFIGSGKRLEATLTAVYDLVSEGQIDPDRIYFAIAGATGGGWGTSGAYIEQLEAAIAHFGCADYTEIRVGFVPFEDLPYWYGAADVAVNCSQWTAYSASGRLRLPAMYGCPQIAEAVPLHHDMIEAHAAEGFAFGDLAGLRAAILRLYQSKSRRHELAAAGRAYCRATTWSQIAADLGWWYEGSLHG